VRSERAAPVAASAEPAPRGALESERSAAPQPPVVAEVEPPAPAVSAVTEPRPSAPSPAEAPPRAAEPSPPPPAASSVPRGETRAATLIAQREPEFPKRAKRSGITEGQVAVDYTVDRNGQVRDIRVVSSKPKGFFDQAAIDALQQWKYRPKLVDGVPSESRHRFTFRFQ
jgi:protein TonB